MIRRLSVVSIVLAVVLAAACAQKQGGETAEGKSPAAKGETGKAAAERPAAEKPAGEQPAAQPGAEQPAAEQPAGEQPAAQPGAEQPAAEKPAEQPSAAEPVAGGESPAVPELKVATYEIPGLNMDVAKQLTLALADNQGVVSAKSDEAAGLFMVTYSAGCPYGILSALQGVAPEAKLKGVAAREGGAPVQSGCGGCPKKETCGGTH